LTRDGSRQLVHDTIAPLRGLDFPADVLAELPIETNELGVDSLVGAPSSPFDQREHFVELTGSACRPGRRLARSAGTLLCHHAVIFLRRMACQAFGGIQAPSGAACSRFRTFSFFLLRNFRQKCEP
jgi:hypothetical protein